MIHVFKTNCQILACSPSQMWGSADFLCFISLWIKYLWVLNCLLVKTKHWKRSSWNCDGYLSFSDILRCVTMNRLIEKIIGNNWLKPQMTTVCVQIKQMRYVLNELALKMHVGIFFNFEQSQASGPSLCFQSLYWTRLIASQLSLCT